MKKLILLLLILSLCLALSACAKVGGSEGGNLSPGVSTGQSSAAPADSVEPAAATPTAEPFALFPAYLELPLGQHLTLDAATAPAGQALSWLSSNPSVATVDGNGRITPVAVGEAVITATAGDMSSTCGVSVTADGNIYLWEHTPEPVDEATIQAEIEAES